MAIKKKKSGGGGANWMDTYGDMVTLLLCFFVLLYSMSTISEENWKAIVLSFNPNAVQDQREIESGNENGPSADPDETGSIPLADLTPEEKAEKQEEIESALMALYQAMKEYAESSGSAQNIEVTKGDGYVFISFNDAVFFDGNKYDLRPDGQTVLQVVCDALSVASEYIDEVRIMGHTAQASPNVANPVRDDRFLASNRATIAAVYIQEHSTVDQARIVVESFGQWRPVADNDTEEERRKNRRVEMMVTGKDLFNELGDSLEQYESQRKGEAHLTTEAS